MNLIAKLRTRSDEEDYEMFCRFLEHDPEANLLDIGCGDGKRALQFAKTIGTNYIVGLDVQSKGAPFVLVMSNLEEGIPLLNERFDVITAANIIEHVSNTDLFVKEVYRVLKPGGYTVIATPNLASGRMIFDLLLDHQPGDADVSDFFRVRGEHGLSTSKGYLHRRLFTLEGLVALLTYHGFVIERKVKEGYGRFVFGKILMGKYACNLIVKARKQ